MKSFPSEDEKWMRQALALAEKGRPWASPNPLVGAVLVKHNHSIGSGYHTKFGAPHAEIEAIHKAGGQAKGSTLYVTLEPCSTYGKTPPCTEAIKRAGIKRVVMGAFDPNPANHGRAGSMFKKNKIQVTKGILEPEVLHQNEAFVTWMTTGLPFVILKMAQSLDGKIASRTGNSRWISGPTARAWVHHLRSQVDAILIGKNTLLRDNPRLTVRTPIVQPAAQLGNGKSPLTLTLSPWGRGKGEGIRSPWRIVLDPRGESPLSARIFKGKGPVILACAENRLSHVTKKYSGKGITILPLKERHGALDLPQLLRFLGSMGITSLLVEGGGELAGSFMEHGLVDQVKWIIAPKIIGGRDAKTSVEGAGIKLLSEATQVKSVNMSRLGDDFLLEGSVA